MSLRLPLLITAYQPLYWKKKDFIAIIIRAVNWRMVKVWQQSHRFKTWYRFTAWKNHSGVAVSFSAAVDSLWSVPAPLHEASRAPAAHPVSIKELEESKNLCRVITRDYHWTCFQYLYCIVFNSTTKYRKGQLYHLDKKFKNTRYDGDVTDDVRSCMSDGWQTE